MPKPLLLALAVAILSGLAIGVQASLNSAAGRVLGATLTGLLVNFVGGIVAGLLLALGYSWQGGVLFAGFTASTLGVLVVSGLLGIGIIAGIAYALPKVGVAAGLASVIAGQMVVALLVDTLGLSGGPPIPLDWSRLAGLGLLAVGTWALLPKG
jgi:transporter family-2 protein